MPAIVGRFPYGETATVRAQGLRRKERFAPGAFRRSVDMEFEPSANLTELRAAQAAARADLEAGNPIGAETRRRLEQLRRDLEPSRLMPDVTLLRGHNFDQPIASRQMGSLQLRDTPDALTFRALIPRESDQPAYLVDLCRMLRSGLIAGVSPGFRPPPARRNPEAVRVVQDRGEQVLTREIQDAVLLELSLVTRPAYKGTSADEERSVFAGDVQVLDDEFEVRSAWAEFEANLEPVSPRPAPAAREDEEALWL